MRLARALPSSILNMKKTRPWWLGDRYLAGCVAVEHAFGIFRTFGQTRKHPTTYRANNNPGWWLGGLSSASHSDSHIGIGVFQPKHIVTQVGTSILDKVIRLSSYTKTRWWEYTWVLEYIIVGRSFCRLVTFCTRGTRERLSPVPLVWLGDRGYTYPRGSDARLVLEF